MLDNQEFNNWCREQNLSSKAQAVIEEIRSTNPSRRVTGGRKNVCGSYPSAKMGVTIQFELCNTRRIQRLPDIASIVVNALHDNIQFYKQC
jgi:hypothetical protein